MDRKARKNKASIPILATAKAAPSAAFKRFKVTRPRSRPLTNPLKQAFFQEMKGAKPKYKLLKLYSAGGDLAKEWYVQYWFLDPATNKYERFKVTFDMNREHELATRMLLGKRAVEFMKRQLDSGYDPIQERALQKLADVGEQLQEISAVIGTPLSVITGPPPALPPKELIMETIEVVVERLSMGATDNAQTTYKTMLTRWRNFIKAKEYHYLSVGQISNEHVKEFMYHLQFVKKNSRKTINATKAHLGLFWDELVDMKRVSSNPFREVKSITKKAGRRMANKSKDPYVPPTTEELERIVRHLNEIGKRDFLRFLAMIYYAWVRPAEITRLQIGDIDLKNATIRFPKEGTKNEKGASVQIVPPLLELLKEMEMEKCPKHYHIFSDNYLPGPTQANPNEICYRAWTWWVKGKLGIDKNPYSLKHKGNIDYVMNNKGDKYDAKWQQMQNRHSSLAQTEQYMRDLGVYFVDTEQLTFKGFV